MAQPGGGKAVTTIIERTGPRGFRLFGSVDASNAAGFADLIEGCLDQPGDITLEMRELELLDSVGMGVLAIASSRLGEQGKLILQNPVHTVARAIELAGLVNLKNVEIVETAGLPDEITAIEEPPS
jgi:anti-anti-sigma factor